MPKVVSLSSTDIVKGFNIDKVLSGTGEQVAPQNLEGHAPVTPPAAPPAPDNIVGNKDLAPESTSSKTPDVVIKLKNELATQTPAQPDTQVVEEAPKNEPTDFDALLSEKSGGKFKSWDEVQTLLASDVPASGEPQFANDFSKQIYENLVAGKDDEVAEALVLQKRLKDVDSWDGERAIKESMRIQHPEWDEEDVADEYDIRFSNLESENDTDKRRAKRLFKAEEQKAKEFLNTQKKDLKLPKIERSEAKQVQPSAEDLEKAKKYREDYLNGLKNTKENFKGFEFNVADDDLEISTKYNLDDADKGSLFDSLQDFDLQNFFETNYFKDGKYDIESLAKDMYLLKRDDKGVPNYQKLVASQIRQVFTEAKLALGATFKGRDNSQVQSMPGSGGGSKKDKDLQAYLEATRL